MRIAVDGCAFERRAQRGIQRYFYQIFLRCRREDQIEMFLRSPLVSNLPQGLNLIEAREDFPRDRRDIFGRVVAKACRNWRPTQLPRGDVFHSTFYTQSPHAGVPEVLTVHDMVPEILPHHFTGDASHEIALKKKCILSASKIIAISAATATDLKMIYPEVIGRVEIIHHGGDHLANLMFSESFPRVSEDVPYVVFVGERAGYKNFHSLVEAVTNRNWPSGLNVVVIGANLTVAELTSIRYRGVESKFKVVIHPCDSELKRLLVASEAFIFPSLLEGFGFPILEAQALGVPVVASDIEVFREVGGDGFIPVNPVDPTSIALAVGNALDQSTSERLVTLGLLNLKRFSWDECAARTFQVWSDASNESLKSY